ncbi:MAG TPA: SBBP repeat-containing protein, partial [Rhodanobacteraceae bacterium]|nr:SBBP repeat-containing protein [Rhodanobacteraceae bacterium]
MKHGWSAAIALASTLLAVSPAPAAQLAYAGYLGGNTTDQAFAVAVDAAGSTYVAGSTESLNFPVVNAPQPQLKGATDAFVAKIGADGTTLEYATYLGGSGLDVATGIAVDADGSIFVTGFTNSIDFPVTPGVVQTHLKGKLFDAFVLKITLSGAIAYSTYLGGSYVDIANAIRVDGAHNAYLAGYTCSYDFPTTKNASQPFLKGGPPGCFSGQDAFVAKLDANAKALVYSTFFGGSDKDEATSLALDAQGRAFVAGHTSSNDLAALGFPLTPYRGARDAFVARFDTAGALGYASYFGGADNDTAAGVAVGAGGDVYVTGYTASPDFPTANAFQSALFGPEDGFVARIAFTQTSATILYSTYLGGGDGDRLHAIATDPGGNAYVAGYTESLDFPTVTPTQPALDGPRDAVVARLDPAG